MPTLRIGLLLFPRMTQLDLTGPFEVFARLPDAQVLLLGKTLEPIEADSGLRLLPDATLRDCPPLDVVCVPGGPGVNALMEDPEILAWLRQQAEHARYVSSVCSGSLVLGAAGLLRGKRATSHWGARDLLAAFGATPTEGRVVRDGNLFTGGGVTAGIDFALTMAAELADPPSHRQFNCRSNTRRRRRSTRERPRRRPLMSSRPHGTRRRHARGPRGDRGSRDCQPPG